MPSCADVRGTFPSAWTSAQLGRMSQDELKRCVEVFAQDAATSLEQRRALWVKLRQVSGGGGVRTSGPERQCLLAVMLWLLVCWLQALGPVRHLRADQLLSLGSLVTEMSERELHDVSFTDPAVLAHLGTLSGWSPKKVRL